MEPRAPPWLTRGQRLRDKQRHMRNVVVKQGSGAHRNDRLNTYSNSRDPRISVGGGTGKAPPAASCHLGAESYCQAATPFAITLQPLQTEPQILGQLALDLSPHTLGIFQCQVVPVQPMTPHHVPILLPEMLRAPSGAPGRPCRRRHHAPRDGPQRPDGYGSLATAWTKPQLRRAAGASCPCRWSPAAS